MRFDGKFGLVTGGGSGIGRATAIGFAQRGGGVAVVDLNGANAEKVTGERLRPVAAKQSQSWLMSLAPRIST